MNDAVEKATELINRSEFVRLLGMEILELDKEHAKGRMPFDIRYCNPFGTMHGGSLYSLADTVTGTLANHVGCDVNTIDGSLNFLEAAAGTEYVYCIATLKKCGRHLVTVEAEIKDDDGKLLDCGLFTFFRMQSR